MLSVSEAFVQARDGSASREDAGLALAVLPGLPAARASEWPNVREEVTSRLLVDQSSGEIGYSVILDGSADYEPDEAIVAPPGYPNVFVDLAIRTHLPSSGGAGLSALSRNHVNVLSSDVLVALPGGSGTAFQIELAIRYGVPVCRFLGRPGSIDAILSEKAEAAAPAFYDFASVQLFVRKAVEGGHHRSSIVVPNSAVRSRSHQGSLSSLA